ncbi:DIP1984 family protein [Ignatzschineria larvae]|nr:DIP1984 family protein [Ignatzschineria larvae]
MTLGEALNIRADLQKRIAQLNERLLENVKVQEGDTPALDPIEVRKELFIAIDQLGHLVGRINQTNNETPFSETMSLADALIERENLMKKRDTLNQMINRASENTNRYSMSEIKFLSIVDVAELSKEYDALAKKWRELDTQIQATNWRTALVEPK